ncbi:RNA-directed DNA polymerase, eukaryota [Tanacetum coccineum]
MLPDSLFRCDPVWGCYRLTLEKLATLVNMDSKGINVASLLCPVCCECVENVNHPFFSCGMSRDLWARLARWCDLNIPEISNLSEWISWLDACQVTKKAMFILEGIAASIVGPMDIYDSDGGIGDSRVLRSRSGVWPNILRSIEEIKKIGVPLDSLMTRKVVSSEQTSFWNDDWLTAGVSLRESFLNLYALEIEKDCRLCDR